MATEIAKAAARYRQTRDRYIDAFEVVTQNYPALLSDPLIAAAMQQIRIATLAIEARVKELDDEHGYDPDN